jgi:hypothetical protein
MKIKNFLRDIFFWFKPRQKWLFEKIPNGYCDACDIIHICLFETFLHFVETQNGLQKISTNGSPSHLDIIRENAIKKLTEVYNYLKNERPQIQQRIDDSHPVPTNDGSILYPIHDAKGKETFAVRSCEEIYGMSYQEAFGRVRMGEEELFEKDTLAMNKIIEYRVYLW